MQHCGRGFWLGANSPGSGAGAPVIRSCLLRSSPASAGRLLALRQSHCATYRIQKTPDTREYIVGFPTRRKHDLVSAAYSLRKAQRSHPADRGTETDQLLNLWLAIDDRRGIGFGSCDDEILIQVLSAQLIAGRLPGSCLGALAPTADHGFGQCRQCREICGIHLSAIFP